jgi:hypothetical protein
VRDRIPEISQRSGGCATLQIHEGRVGAANASIADASGAKVYVLIGTRRHARARELEDWRKHRSTVCRSEFSEMLSKTALGIHVRWAHEPDVLIKCRSLEPSLEPATEQDELRILVDARHVPSHVTQVVEHTVADWFAGPFRFAGDDDTVAGDPDYFELSLSLSAWLFGRRCWDWSPPGTYTLNFRPGAGLHLVKNPRTADLFECWLGHEVVEGRPDYVGIESLNVGTVLESVAVRQDKAEPEAQIGV